MDAITEGFEIIPNDSFLKSFLSTEERKSGIEQRERRSKNRTTTHLVLSDDAVDQSGHHRRRGEVRDRIDKAGGVGEGQT
jgi:hypothetical protein